MQFKPGDTVEIITWWYEGESRVAKVASVRSDDTGQTWYHLITSRGEYSFPESSVAFYIPKRKEYLEWEKKRKNK